MVALRRVEVGIQRVGRRRVFAQIGVALPGGLVEKVVKREVLMMIEAWIEQVERPDRILLTLPCWTPPQYSYARRHLPVLAILVIR
jgi:hypothetical protein